MQCPCGFHRGISISLWLEFDVNRFAVEDLIYSCISPRKELLVEVEEIDHEECSCCEPEYRCEKLQSSAYKAFLSFLHCSAPFGSYSEGIT